MNNRQTLTFGAATLKAFGSPLLQQVRRLPIEYDMGRALAMAETIGRFAVSGFVIDEANRFVYENLIRWLMGDESACCHQAAGGKVKAVKADLAKGIYLCGPTGTGKTVAVAVLEEMARQINALAEFGGQTRGLTWTSETAAEIWDACANGKDRMREYVRRPVLCIQDLAAESPEDAVYMGNRRKPLRSILEARGDYRDRLTIVTSNHAPDSPVIQKRYSDRVVSRMLGSMNVYYLSGKDRRICRCR